MVQWSLYIDIEGFAKTYEVGSQALISLGALMEGIYSLGSRCFVESPNRIFAHQVGDGFIIVGEFPKESLEDAISIAILLLRQITLAGGVGKAAISEGGFADVMGCYPKVVRSAASSGSGGAFPLGGGIMTVFPVMGTALINAYRLISRSGAPSGPLLLISKQDLPRLPQKLHAEVLGDYAIVDWVHASLPRVQELATSAQLTNPSAEITEQLLERYMKLNTLSQVWRANAIHYLHLAGIRIGTSASRGASGMTDDGEISRTLQPGESHYNHLIEYFKWLVGITFGAAAIVIGVGGFFFYRNISDMKADAKTEIAAAAESAHKEIIRIGEQASGVALGEARSRVEEAFRKEDVVSMVRAAAVRQVGPAIEERVDKELDRAGRQIQESIDTMGRIADLGVKMRLGLREAADQLKQLGSTSSNLDERRRAQRLYVSIAGDYESMELRQLGEAKSGALATFREDQGGNASDPLPELLKEISMGSDLNRISLAYLALRDVTGQRFAMFDLEAVEQWCRTDGSNCKWFGHSHRAP